MDAHKTVLPLPDGAQIMARIGNLGTMSPYLDCFTLYSVSFIGIILGDCICFS